ncbi:unnamed protein product [Rhizophagus irregularis]|nr:unnamed protein product [Rhizophagus irregularis]
MKVSQNQFIQETITVISFYRMKLIMNWNFQVHSMLVQPTSNINSGNSVENAIPIDALELSTDSYQNVNSNIPNVRQMVTFRWVNVTNPLERRTRRESAEF